MRYLYLLQNRSRDAFKIGIAFNPARRGAQLPQELSLEHSLQAPVIDGNAYKVEKILHYLFRSYSQEVDFCDGYTEWFDIKAWDGVLNVLTAQRDLLGIGDAQPVRFAFPPSQPDQIAIGICSQTEVELARMEQRSRRCATNSDINNQKIGQLADSLFALMDAGAFCGVLVYNALRSKYRSAVMYINLRESGVTGISFDPRVISILEEGVPLSYASRGGTKVFPAFFSVSNGRRSLVRLSVNLDFIGLGSGEADLVPGASRVQELLSPFVALEGNRNRVRLLRLHRLMCAYLAAKRSGWQAPCAPEGGQAELEAVDVHVGLG